MRPVMLCLALAMPVAGAWGFETELRQRLASGTSLSRLYSWLSEQPVASTQRVVQQRWLGQLALELGHYGTAADHFERVVLAQPNDFGTRLDLTHAYLRAGNAPAARASLAALKRRLGEQPVPAPAAAQLARLEQALATGASDRPGPGLRWRGQVRLTEGYDSNANLGASDRRIPLSIGGQWDDFALLDDRSLARSSFYTELAVDARLHDEASTQAAWQLLAGGRSRRYHSLDILHREEAYLGGRWHLGDDALAQGFLRHHQIEGVEDAWRAQAGYLAEVVPDVSLLLEGHYRQEAYRHDSYQLDLTGYYDGKASLLWLGGSWEFRPQRSAGDTWRVRVGGQYTLLESSRWTVSATAQAEYRQDTQPYSFLFFGDEVRRESAYSLELLARRPLGREFAIEVEGFWRQTDASIALFEHRRWGGSLALEWRW